MSHSPDPYLSPSTLSEEKFPFAGGAITTYRPTRVYLAGPMRGHDLYNFPAFESAADDLRRCGYEVWSPAEYDLEHGFDPTTPEDEIAPLREFMRVDLPQVLNADALVMLDGWEDSTGATLEKHVADACDIPAYDYPVLSLIEGKQMDPDNGLNIAKGGLQQDNEYPYARDTSAQKFWTSKRVVTNHLTGGQKETRAARFDLLPWDQLWRVAELYAYGATKYEDRNWEQGYDFSLSIAALHRHMAKFVQGESYDQESGQHHLSSVVFHALALMRYEQEIERGNLPEELDNRPEVPIEHDPNPGQLTIDDLKGLQWS